MNLAIGLRSSACALATIGLTLSGKRDINGIGVAQQPKENWRLYDGPGYLTEAIGQATTKQGRRYGEPC
ncbi:hypothetical protein A6U98_29480 [Rhizobium sp. WYCCWR10014]|nr:hypothetical protein A6U98_29480 [Rhizobium sp. WYCCWR10014]